MTPEERAEPLERIIRGVPQPTTHHLYLEHLKGIVATLEALNAIEKLTPNEPTAVYMEGPIQLALDGERVSWRFRNDIGDEWCLEIGDES